MLDFHLKCKVCYLSYILLENNWTSEEKHVVSELEQRAGHKFATKSSY